MDRFDESPVRAQRWSGQDFTVRHDGIGRPIAALQIDPADGGDPVSAGKPLLLLGALGQLECRPALMADGDGRVDAPFWVGDRVFISFNPHHDLGEGDNSQDWTTPERLLRSPGHTLWYPCLQPTDEDHDVEFRRTSTRLGRRSRLFVKTLSGESGRYASDFVLELRK